MLRRIHKIRQFFPRTRSSFGKHSDCRLLTNASPHAKPFHLTNALWSSVIPQPGTLLVAKTDKPSEKSNPKCMVCRLRRKRKMRLAGWSAPMHTAFVRDKALGGPIESML